MSEAKFTAGPWRVLPNEPSGFHTKKGERRGPSICGVTTAFSQICIHALPDGKACPDAKTLDAIGEANAHLIAAAPDLLEALQSIATHLEADYGPHTLKMLAGDLAQAARAAIAKATNPDK